MEFYLETHALFRAKNILNENGADLPQLSSLSVVAGFPHYAPDCQGFGELVSEIARYHQNTHQFLASKPIRWEEATDSLYDLKDLNLPPQSVDWMITYRNFFSRMKDGEVRDFFKESDSMLKENGFIFAFHRVCLLPFKERMLRYVAERLGLGHDYRRTYEWLRELAYPLKTVLEAEVSNGPFRFALTVLSKQSNLLPAHQGLTYAFELGSYYRDNWK